MKYKLSDQISRIPSSITYHFKILTWSPKVLESSFPAIFYFAVYWLVRGLAFHCIRLYKISTPPLARHVTYSILRSGELFTEAAEAAMSAMNGRLANKWFMLAEEVWAECEEDEEWWRLVFHATTRSVDDVTFHPRDVRWVTKTKTWIFRLYRVCNVEGRWRLFLGACFYFVVLIDVIEIIEKSNFVVVSRESYS